MKVWSPGHTRRFSSSAVLERNDANVDGSISAPFDLQCMPIAGYQRERETGREIRETGDMDSTIGAPLLRLVRTSYDVRVYYYDSAYVFFMQKSNYYSPWVSPPPPPSPTSYAACSGMVYLSRLPFSWAVLTQNCNRHFRHLRVPLFLFFSPIRPFSL